MIITHLKPYSTPFKPAVGQTSSTSHHHPPLRSIRVPADRVSQSVVHSLTTFFWFFSLSPFNSQASARFFFIYTPHHQYLSPPYIPTASTVCQRRASSRAKKEKKRKENKTKENKRKEKKRKEKKRKERKRKKKKVDVDGPPYPQRNHLHVRRPRVSRQRFPRRAPGCIAVHVGTFDFEKGQRLKPNV